MKDPHDTATIDFIGLAPECSTPVVNTAQLPDSFKDFPTVLGDYRSDVTRKGADWTPRELLLTMLKKLDSGAAADTMIISWAWVDEKGKTQTNFLTANKDPLRSIGLAAMTLANYT